MLEPTNRTVLTEMLQPPHGFTLSQAVGTTFTLDLASALSVPLSFASRQLSDHDDVGIMAALARLSDRISIFAQAGEIYRGIRSDLVALLENVIHPVQPPAGGLFHPKVWLLEFERTGAKSAHEADVERRYRFLNLSRNLTEDVSWDLSVRLDSRPVSHEDDSAAEAAQTRNGPLVALVELLPELALRPLPTQRIARLHELATRIATVEWEFPGGVDDLSFHLLDGSGKDTLPHVEATQALIMSPFVSADGLEELRSGVTGDTRLLSRIPSIEQLPSNVVQRTTLDTYVLDDGTAQLPEPDPVAVPDPPADSVDSADVPEHAEENATATTTSLSGLHAKAFFYKTRTTPYRARALLGSANATSAALHHNVEMMVEIVGSPRQFGPYEILQQLGTMIEPYEAQGDAATDSDEETGYRLESAVRQLAYLHFTVQIVRGEPYSAIVWSQPDVSSQLERLDQAGITVECHLLSRLSGTAQPVAASPTEAIPIDNLELHEITPFVQVTATQATENGTMTRSTIVVATLLGDIENRVDAILANRIGNTESFLQLLILLLDPSGFGEFAQAFAAGPGDAQWRGGASLSGLFETIMRAVAHDDSALDTVQGIVHQLATNPQWADGLPDGFTQLWENVQELRRKGVHS